MKVAFRNMACVLKKYYFVLFAVVALVLPDVLLKRLIAPGSFSEEFVPVAAGIFTAAWICFIVLFCVFVLPKKWGRIVFLVLSFIFVALAFSEYIYHKIFNQFFWLKSIALAGEGTDYLNYVVTMVDKNLLIIVAGAVLSMILAAVLWQTPAKSSKWRWTCLLVPALVLGGVHVYMQPAFHNDAMNQWDTWRKPRPVYKNFNDVNRSFEVTGLYQFTYLNLYTMIFPNERYSEEDYNKVDAFYAQKGEMAENDYTGLFKGKNVIAVMLESIDTWTIDRKTTPTLYKMMYNGINFSGYHAPMFGVGFTFSSEFAFNTGYFTPLSATSAAHFSTNRFPYALANLFKEAGYTTNSFHFNDAGFYNRGIMHKAFGYEKYNALSDFGLTGIEAELDSNMMKNEAVYKKMTEKQPFFNFVITYSAHLPYTDDSAKLQLAKEYRPDLVNLAMHREKNNMQILAADTDAFFKQLLDRLEADGLLDDTVIVAYTDHFAYGISDGKMLNMWKGRGLSYRVPAFIYAKGIRPKRVTKPMMTVDWAPTLVNLFGLNRAGGYLGNDVLNPDYDGFAYFENWSWLDNKRYYNPSEEGAETSDYITEKNQLVRDSMEVNNIVVLGDYYKKH